MNIKHLIQTIGLSLAIGFSSSVAAEPISRDNFVAGKGVLLVEDTDIYWLVLDNRQDYNSIMEGVNWRNGAEPEQAIRVKLASVLPLTKRDSSNIDSIAEKTFKLAMKFNEKEVDYICFGIENSDEFYDIPYCSFLVEEEDIAYQMLEIGGATYNLNQYHPWQHEEYTSRESLGRSRKIGIWSPMYGIFSEKNRVKIRN